MRLPGKLLLIAFCALVFTMALMVSPTRAEHPASSPYVCTTLDAAMRTVAYVQAGEIEELKTRARTDIEFKCVFIPTNIPFYVQEIVHAYVEDDVQKVVVRALDAADKEVYLFGTKTFALGQLHQDES
jgi:hypothetical protein